jgi:septal ring-binding cell division protein DamX/chromosome segregation ATPase
VESASDELSVLQLRTSDLLDRLNNLQQVPDRLTELEARNAPLDQQLQDHQQVLSRLEQRVEQLNRQRDTLSERLEEETERLAEHAGRGEATAQKVADVEGNIEQLKQQISVLQQAQQQETQGLGGRLDELGEGHRQLADENRLLIAQLRERIEQLGEAQERIDEGGQTLVEKLDLSDERVQALQQDSQTLAQRLQDMADLPERVSQLEQRVSPIDEKLAEQGESLTNIRDLLSQLQRSTGELSERISAEAERVNQQHLESDAANQSTMAQLAKDIATCREALSLAEAKIGDLGDSGGRLQSELQETARRIADLAQRDQQRLRMIEAAQDKLGDLNTALDVNADALQRSAQRDQRQDSEIVKVQGAQRLLTWVGAAAALLLIALSLTGYWLADDKQQSQREALMAQLTALEQRLSASALGKPEQLQSLAEDMSDLKLHVRTLDSRFDDMPLLEPASDSPPPDDYALQQNNIMQALDELNARLAEIEKSPTAAATDAAAKPATRALAQQATLDEWSQAQAQARFTLQIVGVQDKAALNRFVRKYRLQEGSAYLKTEYKDHPWYVLFHGVYKNRASASAAAQQLSKRLNGARPWIRRLPKNGHIQALQSR